MDETTFIADQTEELSQTDRAAMQSMLQSSHTPSVVGEDSLCLDDPKVDADMSQEEAAQPGAQSEAPTAGSSVRNVRGGRLSLLQHTLDVELEARLDVQVCTGPVCSFPEEKHRRM